MHLTASKRHLALDVLRRRSARFAFDGAFHGNRPVCVWEVPSSSLEPYFAAWSTKIDASPNKEINNPKIPVGFVQTVGKLHVVKGAERIKLPKPGRFRPLG